MVFEEIALTKRELKLLKKSAKEEINVADCPRLAKHRLVDDVYSHVQGRMSIQTGRATISDKGVDYLAYVELAEQRRKREHRHNWLIAIFTALAGAFLSKPLWDIIDWIRIVLFGTR